MHQRPVSFTPGADVDAQDEELVVTNWKLFIFREQHLRFQESLSSGTVIRLQHSLKNGYLMASERRYGVPSVQHVEILHLYVTTALAVPLYMSPSSLSCPCGHDYYYYYYYYHDDDDGQDSV